MKTDRGFTHPNFGKTARVEVQDKEVRLIFVADTEDMAHNLASAILLQLKSGAINLTLMGKPTSVVEE